MIEGNVLEVGPVPRLDEDVKPGNATFPFCQDPLSNPQADVIVGRGKKLKRDQLGQESQTSRQFHGSALRDGDVGADKGNAFQARAFAQRFPNRAIEDLKFVVVDAQVDEGPEVLERGRQVGGHRAREIDAVLAETEMPQRETRLG